MAASPVLIIGAGPPGLVLAVSQDQDAQSLAAYALHIGPALAHA